MSYKQQRVGFCSVGPPNNLFLLLCELSQGTFINLAKMSGPWYRLCYISICKCLTCRQNEAIGNRFTLIPEITKKKNIWQLGDPSQKENKDVSPTTAGLLALGEFPGGGAGVGAQAEPVVSFEQSRCSRESRRTWQRESTESELGKKCCTGTCQSAEGPPWIFSWVLISECT